MNEVKQTPEGRLIEQHMAARVPRLSARKAAEGAGMSEARWRQIVKGYQPVAKGIKVPVVAPAETLARMAMALGIEGDDLARAGRKDAAEIVRRTKNLDDTHYWELAESAEATIDEILSLVPWSRLIRAVERRPTSGPIGPVGDLEDVVEAIGEVVDSWRAGASRRLE